MKTLQLRPYYNPSLNPHKQMLMHFAAGQVLALAEKADYQAIAAFKSPSEVVEGSQSFAAWKQYVGAQVKAYQEAPLGPTMLAALANPKNYDPDHTPEPFKAPVDELPDPGQPTLEELIAADKPD